jgi:hypothetical protein
MIKGDFVADEGQPEYFEISDAQLRASVQDLFHADVVKLHSVSEVLKMSEDKWLVKLSPDIGKKMGRKK